MTSFDALFLGMAIGVAISVIVALLVEFCPDDVDADSSDSHDRTEALMSDIDDIDTEVNMIESDLGVMQEVKDAVPDTHEWLLQEISDKQDKILKKLDK